MPYRQTDRQTDRQMTMMIHRAPPVISLDMVEAQHTVRELLEGVIAASVGIIDKDETTVSAQEHQ